MLLGSTFVAWRQDGAPVCCWCFGFTPHLRQAPGPVRRDTTLGAVWLFFNYKRGVNRRMCKTGLESRVGEIVLSGGKDEGSGNISPCWISLACALVSQVSRE